MNYILSRNYLSILVWVEVETIFSQLASCLCTTYSACLFCRKCKGCYHSIMHAWFQSVLSSGLDQPLHALSFLLKSLHNCYSTRKHPNRLFSLLLFPCLRIVLMSHSLPIGRSILIPCRATSSAGICCADSNQAYVIIWRKIKKHSNRHDLHWNY